MFTSIQHQSVSPAIIRSRDLRVIGRKVLFAPTMTADGIKLDRGHHINITIRQNITQLVRPSFPAYLRLPKNGERCPVSGLSKSALSSLIRGANPKVESFPLMQSGANRGQRMIVTESLLIYLDSLRPEGRSRIEAKHKRVSDSSRLAIPMGNKTLNVPA
ncbi:hypothetical protein NT6N_04550 [Oceaniferula spumae]|uniref:Pyocin activator protein PrtN n=1 Tax=Oceaniferula spumae TaxID=2979115 RepID=A0AAT9FHH0_9BACT